MRSTSVLAPWMATVVLVALLGCSAFSALSVSKEEGRGLIAPTLVGECVLYLLTLLELVCFTSLHYLSLK